MRYVAEFEKTELRKVENMLRTFAAMEKGCG
jgi:hypothetical protein